MCKKEKSNVSHNKTHFQYLSNFFFSCMVHFSFYCQSVFLTLNPFDWTLFGLGVFIFLFSFLFSLFFFHNTFSSFLDSPFVDLID